MSVEATVEVIRRRIAAGEYPAVTSPDQREGLVLTFAGAYRESEGGEGTTYEFESGDRRGPIVAWDNGGQCDCSCDQYRKARKKRYPCAHIWAVRYVQAPPTHDPSGPAVGRETPRPAGQARDLTPAHALAPALVRHLTEDSAAYEEALAHASSETMPMLRELVAGVIDNDPRNKSGRPRIQRRAAMTLALLGVSAGLSLRKAHGAEVERTTELILAKQAGRIEARREQLGEAA
ncbi:MAG TPA: SWIM zinc finger family protein [Candidatus Sulfotelmatobacter sp.]|nr:SWIM zinc finger family protein [Candidatus Sulfotelmatobacter sp.]